MCFVTGFQGIAGRRTVPVGPPPDQRFACPEGTRRAPGVVGSVVPAVATTSSPPSAPAAAAAAPRPLGRGRARPRRGHRRPPPARLLRRPPPDLRRRRVRRLGGRHAPRRRCPSGTCSPARARCSCRWCGSPTWSASAPSTAPAAGAGLRGGAGPGRAGRRPGDHRPPPGPPGRRPRPPSPAASCGSPRRSPPTGPPSPSPPRPWPWRSSTGARRRRPGAGGGRLPRRGASRSRPCWPPPPCPLGPRAAGLPPPPPPPGRGGGVLRRGRGHPRAVGPVRRVGAVVPVPPGRRRRPHARGQRPQGAVDPGRPRPAGGGRRRRRRRAPPSSPAAGRDARRPPSTPGSGPRRACCSWSWLAATVLVLLTEHPLWRPHISFLVPPVVLLAVRRPLAVGGPGGGRRARRPLPRRPPRRPAAARRAPGRRAGRRGRPPGPPRRGPGHLRPAGPGVAGRAGRRRRMPSTRRILRIDSEREGIQVTARSLAEEAAQPEVCAVAVWSQPLRRPRGLPERLADAGYRVAATYGGPRVLYEKTDCSP